jgi:lysophospholipase L1-like esterase
MAAGKLDLSTDLKFGTLNAIEDANVANSGDRRRTSSISALNASMRAAYDPNTLEDVERFTGIVVHKRVVTSPRYTDRMGLLETYVASSGAPSEGEASGSTDAADASSGLQQNYQTTGRTAYKVYVPEVEPRPAPSGPNDPVLNTYPDMFAATGRSDLEELPIGGLVEIEYEDPERLFNPQIVEGSRDRYVLLDNFQDIQSDSQAMFGQGPTFLLSSMQPSGDLGGFSSGQGNSQVALLIGDSQSDGGSTLGGYLPKEIEKQGRSMKVVAKYGKGLIAGKSHWDIENTNGIVQTALAQHRPGYVIIELGGNDSYWVGAGTSESKKTTYNNTMKTWLETIKSYGNPSVIWLGPSKATKIGENGTPYDSLRQNVRDWQKSYLSSVGVTWYSTVPYTEDLPMQEDGVHFTAASYKKWAERLTAPGAPFAPPAGGSA